MSRRFLTPGSFRLFLALAVFFGHLSRLALGVAAVYLFFILSGYWIYVMWHKTYKFSTFPYRLFVTSRFWRILPIFFISTILMICVRVFIIHAGLPAVGGWINSLHFGVSNFILLGYAQLPGEQILIVPAWSLDVEVQFYLLAPLLIALLDSKHLRFVQSLLFAAAATGAAFLFYTAAPTTCALPRFLVFFLIGLLAAKHRWRPTPWLAFFSSLAAIAFIAAIITTPHLRGVLLGSSDPGPMFIYNGRANLILAFISIPLAILSVNQPSGMFDRHLGNLSYEVYLVHVIVVDMAASFYPALHGMQKIPLALAEVALVLLVSFLIYWFIDRRLDKTRHGFVQRRVMPEEKPVKIEIQRVVTQTY